MLPLSIDQLINNNNSNNRNFQQQSFIIHYYHYHNYRHRIMMSNIIIDNNIDSNKKRQCIQQCKHDHHHHHQYHHHHHQRQHSSSSSLSIIIIIISIFMFITFKLCLAKIILDDHNFNFNNNNNNNDDEHRRTNVLYKQSMNDWSTLPPSLSSSSSITDQIKFDSDSYQQPPQTTKHENKQQPNSINHHRLIEFYPILRIIKQDDQQSNQIELSINIDHNQLSTLPKLLLPFLINNYVTNDTANHSNNNNNNQRYSTISLKLNQTTADNDDLNNFLSNKLIIAEQLVNNDEQNFFETIEKQQKYNHTNQFYFTNNLFENFDFKNHNNDQRRSKSTLNNKQKQCQLFFNNFQTHNQNDQNQNDHQSNTIQQLRSSSATISICNDGKINGIVTFRNFNGHILIEDESLINDEKLRTTTIDHQHCFDNNNNNNNSQSFESIDLNDELIHFKCKHYLNFVGNFNQKSIKNDNVTMRNRRKRSYSSERTIEISIVTGLSMYIYHKNENSLHNYVFTLIAIVSHLFKHSSIGNEINIKLIKLTLFKDEQQEKNWYSSAHRTLRQFCRWQYEHNEPNIDHPLHYDTAIFLTKIDLCSKNDHSYNHNNNNYGDWIQSFDDNHHHHHHQSTSMKKLNHLSCDTLGLAHSGQICDSETSCAIVEDNGLSAAFTIAHELGHLLGVPHDDEEQCKQFYEQNNDDNNHDYVLNNDGSNNKRPEFNVMVRMIDSNSHMWSWSSCSKHFITEFLDSGHGDCLLDNDSLDIRQSSPIDSRVRVYETLRRRSFLDQYSKLPAGALYNADEQCRLVFDRNSSICLDMPYCRKLWCTSSIVGGCRTQHMPWADGTECGNGYWCQEGKCVRIDHAALHPIDGGWSEWSPWSECSLNCNGGIRRSKRNCTNPSPQYGGKFCIGERVRYESCNIEPCDHQSREDDSRAQQCAEFNRYNLTWTPKYDGILPSEICALHCESNSGESHKLKSRVIDGTPCTPESFDICVNGKCLKAGCDRILGSNRRVDYCGVCGGDNSTCRLINGQIKPRTVQHGYTFILSIPPGATNVEIIKEPSTTSADNWLALRGEYGNYLLNGHFTVNVYERKWYYGGTTVEYSGIQSHGYERINITRSIHNPLHLEILCVGELHLPTISYRFAVTSDNRYITYKWMMQNNWSECNKACNGEQERRAFCVAVMRSSWMMDNSQPQINEIKVNDDYCDQQTRPTTEYRVCYVDCELEWYVHQISDCSAKCGHGYRQQQVNCTQTFINRNERIYIDDSYCRHLGTKPSNIQNCTGNDCRIVYQWQYSEWSQCMMPQHDRNCGQGQQNRVAHCIASTYLTDDDPSNVIHSNVGQELCEQHLSEPAILVQSCEVECPRWRTGQWSKCEGSCGNINTNNHIHQGQKHRSVICVHGEQPVSDAYCEMIEPKPIDRIACELIKCRKQMINYYQFDSNNQTSMKQSSISEYIDTETMVKNNEIYGYHQDNRRRNHIKSSSPSSSWQSGEWSSCDILTQYVTEYHDRYTENFHIPKCFNSIEQISMIREKYLPLFRLNESLHSNSFEQLAQLLGLDQTKLKRRRFVACVDTKNQQVIADSHCSFNTKPNSEEYCPIEQSLLKLMPEFNVQMCSSSSSSSSSSNTNKIPLTSTIIESSPSKSSMQQSFSDTIEWRTSEWSDCFCDFLKSPQQQQQRRQMIRRRSVHCVRIVDGININENYCQQQNLIKPNEIEQCLHYNNNDDDVCNNDHDHQSKHSINELTLTLSSITTSMPSILIMSTKALKTNDQQPITSSTSVLMSSSSSSYDNTIENQQHSSSSTTTTYHNYHQQTPLLFVDSTAFNDNDQRSLKQQQHQQYYSNLFDNSNKSESIVDNHSSTKTFNNNNDSRMTTFIDNSSLSLQQQQHQQTKHGGWTEWNDWSECSVKCGHGIQTREPKCTLAQCDDQQRPSKQERSCYSNNCSLFQWHYSEWSSCQGDCNDINYNNDNNNQQLQQGYRYRTIECRDWTGTRVSNHFCTTTDDQIILKEKCQLIDCNNTSINIIISHNISNDQNDHHHHHHYDNQNKLIWRTGQWSECSKSCGNGEQLRSIACHRINKFGMVDPWPLNEQQFHESTDLIRLRRQNRYVRQQLRGNNRSNRFNQKRNQRSKLFKRRNRSENLYYTYQIIEDNDHHQINDQKNNQQDLYCSYNDRPNDRKQCNLGPCLTPSSSSTTKMIDTFVWRTSKWQPCSSPCGNGYQRRKIYCHSSLTNKRVDRSYCNVRLKPEKRRHCNLRSCEIISCQDRRDRTRIRTDGIYDVWIQGSMIKVYCYGMNFLPKPLEYLILNSDENYSELNNELSRDCTDNYYQQEKRHRTHFKYVRFDVLSMQIYVNDTRFSMINDDNNDNGKALIGFGQAIINGCPAIYGSNNNQQHGKTCHFSSNIDHRQRYSYHDQDNSMIIKAMFNINLMNTGLIMIENDIIDQWIIDDGSENIIHHDSSSLLLSKNIRISSNGEKIVGYCTIKHQQQLPITVNKPIYHQNDHCQIGCRPFNNVLRVRIP